ncbi:ImmA/IrrE family metallo-endopeptidase [Anaerotignum propionicum]|uniref:ImmA/IrrE family metallo-endopeptidase n=1 Tax=Anaerotignum propionicum TaxID=28446 RepID=UPI00210DD5CA|nr:ImmA/IrrE family metallo-endopeptidase [Anaerotignum propionicum]MCQ4935187.1 ImmA/IrrE family metallo-endopeptidase [Anaerotignum propionicum]
MKYRLYQQARNLSWKVLQDCGIKQFPVNLGEICRFYKIKTIPYSKFTLWDMVDSQAKNGDGFSFQMENQYYIVFNDSINYLGRIRFTLAHEIGHILLGHVETITFYRNSEIDSQAAEKETQANIFARDLLMPAVVLSALNVHSATEIAKLCNISLQSAKIRAKRMEELYQRNCFQLHPLERDVILLFKDYIENNNTK